MSKSEAGRLGGLATVAKFGRNYMRELGRKGAAEFWRKYSLKPYGQYQWAIVRREDNVIIGFMQDWRP